MSDSRITPPRHILLATDFSARSDRPLDRALSLAHRWGAELTLAHVIEPEADMAWDHAQMPSWRRGPDREEQMHRRLVRDLGPAASEVKLVVEHGFPADRIPEIAARAKADLVITGVASNPTLGRMVLGTTVQRLARTSPIPVLVVKRRAQQDYRKLLVAVDFSPASADALSHAAGLFPDAEMTLLHGYDAPFLVSDSREAFVDYLRRAEQEEATAFLDKASIDPAQRQRIEVLIEHGDPVRLAETYIADHDPDLTVIASHGRSALYELAIGSTATRMLDRLDSDILLVRHQAGAR